MMSTHVQFGFGSGWPGAENPWHSYSQCYCLTIGSIGVWNLEEEHNPMVDHYFPGWRWLFKGIVHVQTPTHVWSSGPGGSRSLDPAIRVSRTCRCSWHLWWILGGSSQESVQWVEVDIASIYHLSYWTNWGYNPLASWDDPTFVKKNRPSSPIQWSKTAVGEKGWSRVFHGRPRCVCEFSW